MIGALQSPPNCEPGRAFRPPSLCFFGVINRYFLQNACHEIPPASSGSEEKTADFRSGEFLAVGTPDEREKMCLTPRCEGRETPATANFCFSF